jgi:hypothetical protein
MSYQEKKTITSILTGVLVLAAYCIYAVSKSRAGLLPTGDLKSWAITMLIFIGIGIVTSIVIQIVFHILLSISIAVKGKIQNQDLDDKEIEKQIDAEMVEDEMDKLIDLKSNQIGFILAGIGFVAGLVTLAFNYPPAVMLNILFVSFSAGSLVEGFAQLYFYRKGLAHG